jgi:predicted ribosomally synthesized peptide with SipW-like signal peptide
MTQDDNPKLYNLSRRKMLGGLGAIGLASAGAGLGTSALFTDTESFTGNSLTAGTLDMAVTATVVAADEYWTEQGVVGLEATADGEGVTAGLDVTDVKPGDWAIICFDVEISENPGYLLVRTENFTEGPGVTTEPEPTPDEGELGEYLLTTVWQEWDEQVGGKAGLSTLDPLFNLASDELDIPYGEPINTDGGVDTDGDGDFDGDDLAHYTNAREADAILSEGYVVKDNTGAPMVVADGEGAYSFCLLLEIPAAVGNDIQGDTLGFDLLFETEQVRHNEDPFNTTTTTDGN